MSKVLADPLHVCEKLSYSDRCKWSDFHESEGMLAYGYIWCEIHREYWKREKYNTQHAKCTWETHPCSVCDEPVSDNQKWKYIDTRWGKPIELLICASCAKTVKQGIKKKQVYWPKYPLFQKDELGVPRLYLYIAAGVGNYYIFSSILGWFLS